MHQPFCLLPIELKFDVVGVLAEVAWVCPLNAEQMHTFALHGVCKWMKS